MKIRTVKPEFYRHKGLYELEQQTRLPIRVAWSGLFGVCDREGRFKWEPDLIKLDVLPFDEVDFADVLDALLERGFVFKYEVEGKTYGVVPSFLKHQVINNRERPSVLPAPTPEIGPSDASATRSARDERASKTPGYVYIALSPAIRVFKVGFCTRDPFERVKDLSCGSPEELELVEFIRATRGVETEIHNALSKFSSRREWFTISEESLALLNAWFTRAPRQLSKVQEEGKGSGREMEVEVESKERASRKKTGNEGNFISTYCRVWKERYGSRPEILGKEIGIAKRITKGVGPERASSLVESFLRMNTGWFITKRHDLATFEQNLNAVVQFHDTGVEISQTETKHADLLSFHENQLKRIAEGKL